MKNLQPTNVPTFDPNFGGLAERLLFKFRGWFLLLVLAVSLLLGYQLFTKLDIKPGFEKMLPQQHSYIQNFLANRDALRGLGNSVRVVVEHTQGDIFDPVYLETLRQVHDELFLTPGVDRAWVKSLWAPGVRWTQVTEEGFTGGPVMPDAYSGTSADITQLKSNINNAGLVGNLVANDFRSSMIVVPLLDRDSATGKGLDYYQFSRIINEKIRLKHEFNNDPQLMASQIAGQGSIRIRVIGFSQLMGELIAGLLQVASFFAIAFVIASLLIYSYSRCLRSSVLVVSCSLLAVIWQLGLVAWLGYALDPYSVLVPFLTFAIGVSHASQKMNGIMQDIGTGLSKEDAARQTFRRLFIAGLTALLSDAVGFAVLMLIDIPVIQELAITASIGVATLIFTTLLLMPVALSYLGVNAKAARRSLLQHQKDGQGNNKIWHLLELCSSARYAKVLIAGAVIMGVAGFIVSKQLQIGDLDAGAPELRADSRYNLDNAFITSNYSLSSDQFAVIIKTAPEGCLQYQTLVMADQLAWRLQQLPSVQMTVSLANAVRQTNAGANEGNPRFFSLPRNQDMLNYAVQQASVNTPELFNTDCSVMPVIAYLKDHKASTLEQVAAVAAEFAAQHSTGDRQFLLAAGSAGIEAATNQVVKSANSAMLLYVYLGVLIFCLLTFRSWRATLVALLPLILTSILCEALMVVLGIGVKVATLPVIALGVGIGVDYALYLLSVQLMYQRIGDDLTTAYRKALASTGKVVALVGVTLAAGVITWIWSPIKFQADMGILLTFMFIWNMLGALILIPALSHLLLKHYPATTARPKTQASAAVAANVAK